MKKTALFIISMLWAALAHAQQDTLKVSARFTTHVIFSTDITYADMSDSRSIAAKVVEQNKNMIALKARGARVQRKDVDVHRGVRGQSTEPHRGHQEPWEGGTRAAVRTRAGRGKKKEEGRR